MPTIKQELAALLGKTELKTTEKAVAPTWKKGGRSPNPRGRPRKITEQQRADSWTNLLTGVGDPGRDKRLSSTFTAQRLMPAEATELWAGDDLAARIVETWPNEMLRQGFDFRIQAGDDAEKQGLKDLQEQIESRWDDLGLSDALWMALAWERAQGGSAILLGVNDGSADLATPLVFDRVSEFNWITTIEPDELQPVYYYTDPRAPKFGQVAVWRYNPSVQGTSEDGTTPQSTLIHESRLIVFPGIRITRRQFAGSLPGWGQSVLSRVYEVLRDHRMTWSAAAILLSDFAQGVFKMAGLAELVNQDKAAIFKNRIQAMDMSRSVLRSVLIDAEEEFKREQTPLSGLPEMIDRFNARVAAAANMPLTLLMGESPGGLNATGESDVRFFYDRIKAEQVKKLRPAIETITRLILRSMGKQEPEKWSISFRPLWQLSDSELAAARKTQAETDIMYLTNGVLDAVDILRSRFGGDEYSFDTTVDVAEREKEMELEAEEEARRQEEFAARLEAQSQSQSPDSEDETDNQADASQPFPPEDAS